MGNKSLSERNIQLMESNENDIFISIASLWEIAIKIKIGKLNLSIDFKELAKYLLNLKIQILPIKFEDTLKLLDLPLYHTDPFDRMIITQALNNQLLLLSNDENFSKYDIKII
jgi:PIN domain nuclease of toxin-antitoxin system